MLELLLREMNNWFELSSEAGVMSVTDGTPSFADRLLPGQYYAVEGSVFNDGLHLAGEELADEEWRGTVRFLGIPKAVVDLADEVAAWCEANAEALASPYQSESFAGYSYAKEGGTASGGPASWQSHFAPRLRLWRRL